MPINDATSNIAPCPFCGQSRTIVHSEVIPDLGRDEDVMGYLVRCEACNADGPSIIVQMTAKHAESEAAAIDQWNRRADKSSASTVGFKNCPFCGSEPEVLYNSGPEETDTSPDPTTIAEIFCCDCGASGPANDKDDLMALWNKRK